LKQICAESDRLIISPKSPDEMRKIIQDETDDEMKQAYTEMLELMLRLPGRTYWASDWTVRLKQGESIGGIGFKGPPDSDGRVEIGYGIFEAYRRCGYASEAVGAMLNWAFAQPGVRCVCAQTEEDNSISQRVLLKNGFIRNGFGNEGPLFEIYSDAADR